MVFSDTLASVLQAENQVKYNYSSPNSVATELFSVSDAVKKLGKNWNRAEESKTSIKHAGPVKKEWKTWRTGFVLF